MNPPGDPDQDAGPPSSTRMGARRPPGFRGRRYLAMERLLKKLSEFDTNEEFLQSF